MNEDFTMEDTKKMIYQTYGNGIEIIREHDCEDQFCFDLKDNEKDFFSVFIDKKERIPLPIPC